MSNLDAARALLEDLLASGVEVSLTEGGGLRVAPWPDLTGAQRREVKRHKAALAALLAPSQAAEDEGEPTPAPGAADAGEPPPERDAGPTMRVVGIERDGIGQPWREVLAPVRRPGHGSLAELQAAWPGRPVDDIGAAAAASAAAKTRG